MSSYAWVGALAQAAYERGWLTLSAKKKAQAIVEAGLHPEQALIGTALLSVDQYAAIVKGLWGIELCRLDQESYVLRRRRGKDICLIEAENARGEEVIIHVDGWTQSASEKYGNHPVIDTFRSDVLRWLRQKTPIDLSTSEWLKQWSEIEATELRLGVEHRVGVVRVGVGQSVLDDGCIRAEEVPALQTWFEAGYGSRSWRMKRKQGIESDWAELIANHDRHPLAKVQTWKTFLRQPKGILYVVEPDEWLRGKLEHLEAIEEYSTLFHSKKLCRVHPSSSHERETAFHGALSGISFCWIDEMGESMSLMRALAKAHIPVIVVRGRPTAHGIGWETYTMAL